MKAVYSIIIFIGFIVCFNNKLIAQEYYQVGVQAKSLAGITTCISDGWSAFGNQAGMAFLNNSEVGISCSNYFMLQELSLKSAFTAVPYEKNIFAVSLLPFWKCKL